MNYNLRNVNFGIEILSHLGFLAAIGVSMWFHELRSTFGESAMVLFNLINNPDILASSTWFSWSWFQNILTVLAIKSNCSISLVSMVFSASPMIFMYGIFLIANYVFKQKTSGIFLLLLLLGINQTFFGAVHTPLMFVVTFGVLFHSGLAIAERYSEFQKLFNWAFVCFLCFIFFRVSPNVFVDVLEGVHQVSFLGYFSSVAISTFVIPFGMAAYLGLWWMVQKQFKELILLIVWTSLIFLAIFIHGRSGLLDVNFELLWFPFVAGIVGFFVITFGANFQPKTIPFWIVASLVFLSIFGQLRTFQTFEKRQNYVVKLLQHTPKTGSNFVLPEHIHHLEKYIDPTFLAFETPLISSLRGFPEQSVFFIPEKETIQYPERSYTVIDTLLIKRTLYQDITDTSIVTGDGVQYALTRVLRLQRGDSLYLSVLRKGSSFGDLVLSDDLPGNTKLWMQQQTVLEPDADGWQRLILTFIVPETERYRIYVRNENYKKERIYFDDFRIEIWRE
ncbi:MAG: hypothetical protein FWG79_06820 [Bacteroidales bacterium]|nr:hypothetical protein [Bacteroidales bacterium]